MANEFLKVEKSLFGKGLSPIELLVYSQIAEFVRNTGDCFISNAAMASAFGVSEKTVARALDSLEERGLIERHTKASQRGKERHITLAKDNLSLANESSKTAKDNLSVAERTICPLRKGQNDTIKDNIKRKDIKDNIGIDELLSASLQADSSIPASSPMGKKLSTEALTKSEMVAKFRREMGF